MDTRGLEPPRITPYAPQAYAYTNSATCPRRSSFHALYKNLLKNFSFEHSATAPLMEKSYYIFLLYRFSHFLTNY